ncbi:MAG: M55 family metallopeptidase [Candidatus Tumulicola sp.]
MKLYVSCDMEGVAGVTSWQQVDARTPHPEYSTYRAYYTREVAAAIEGARLAGAGEVLVNDSHGPMRNLLFDELPADVRVLFGNRKPFSMVQDADATFGGAFFVGYHGGAGDADAVLCHTYTPSVVYDVRVNGVRCSEAIFNAGLLGHFGIPLLLITGDRTTVDGVRALLPWVNGVVVKESIGNFAAASMTPAAACAAIREGARAAVASAPAAEPYRFESPIELAVDLVKTEQADLVATIPGFARTGGRSVRFTHDDFPTIFKAFVATWRLGGQA